MRDPELKFNGPSNGPFVKPFISNYFYETAFRINWGQAGRQGGPDYDVGRYCINNYLSLSLTENNFEN